MTKPRYLFVSAISTLYYYYFLFFYYVYVVYGFTWFMGLVELKIVASIHNIGIGVSMVL